MVGKQPQEGREAFKKYKVPEKGTVGLWQPPGREGREEFLLCEWRSQADQPNPTHGNSRDLAKRQAFLEENIQDFINGVIIPHMSLSWLR